MRRFLSLTAAVIWLMPAGIASATMVLQSYDAKKHDRFYVGGDKAFIGDPYDWSGVGRSGDRWATMVSDYYFLSATHYHPSVGDSLRFSWSNDPSGSYENRTVESGVQIAGSDLWLGKLSQAVTSNVAKYSILSLAQESSYDDLSLYTYGLSSSSSPQINMRLGRNNFDPDSIQNMTVGASTGQIFLYDYDNPGGMGAEESYLQSGDSGGPSFATFDGKPTLVGIHWFIWDDENQPPQVVGSADTFVPYYVSAVNQTMVGEHLTVVPEPCSFVLFCASALAFFAWNVRWRRI